MENIMLNVRQDKTRQDLIKALFVVIATCGFSGIHAVDWNAWNPRNLATTLYQRLSSFSNFFSQRQQFSTQLREIANNIVHEKEKSNQTLREKLELIANKTGDQNQLWNEVYTLINNGADVNTATKREIEEYGESKLVDDLTALHLAATDRPDMMNFLIEKGANKQQKTADGYTYEDIVKSSQKLSEQPEIQHPAKLLNENKIEELNLALNNIYNNKNLERNWEIVRDIISRNSNLINTEGPDLFTALHLAVNYANVRMVNFLMGYGANPYLQNNNGQTAFEIAHQLADGNAKTEILKFLSKEFGPAQFGSPLEAHKSISQIVQERAHLSHWQKPQTLTPSEELQGKIGTLVEEFIPTSQVRGPLKKEDVAEAYTPASPYY
jgi:ankyrin repeat protein